VVGSTVVFCFTVLLRLSGALKLLLLSLLLWRNNGRTDSRPETNINARRWLGVLVCVCVCVCVWASGGPFFALPGDDSAALRSRPGHFSNRPSPPPSPAHAIYQLATLYVYYDARVEKIHNQSTKVPTI